MSVKKALRRGTKPRWVIDIPYKDRRTGKRVRFRKDADVQTSAAAHAEERRLLVEYAELGYIPTARDKRNAVAETPRSSPTFEEAYRLFTETKAVTRLKRTTWRGYEMSLKAHLLPRWRDVRVDQLGWAAFEKLDAELKTSGIRSNSTRARILTVARSVIRYCVDARLLTEFPRLPPLPKGGEKVVTPPRPEAIDAALAVASPTTRLALAIAADAGLRAGEIRGLEWQDANLVERTLTVRQTIYYGEKDTPKSGHERKVPMTPRLFDLISEASKLPHEPTDPLAPSSRGRPWGESSLNHALHMALAKANLAPTKLHSLRHLFVSECFKVGGGAPTVQALAGHKHMHVTARYAHTDEQAKREVIERLGRRGA